MTARLTGLVQDDGRGGYGVRWPTLPPATPTMARPMSRLRARSAPNDVVGQGDNGESIAPAGRTSSDGRAWQEP